jgi:hypothetical protein
MTPADLPPLTRNEKRYLAKFQCAWCDQRIDQDCCGAIYEKCSNEVIAKRREECLTKYKPRKK